MSTLTTQQRSDIDKLWTEFWTGGITNPLTVIEQISFLMFARLLDVMETTGERKAERTKKPFKGRFNGKDDPRRWKNFKQKDAGEMLRVVRDEVFKHFRELNGGTTFGEYMKDAQLMVQKPNLLVQAVNMIDALPITEGDAKGDLYEYLLSKLTTAGINGQFRTPRHIIRFMVELLEPKPTESVADPACGTAGFLVGVMRYLLETHTSSKGKIKGENGETIYTGDLLEPYRDHIQSGMFHGFDFDATMLRIASMNLMLHGVDNPDIHYQDTLSNSFPEKFPKQATGGFDVILANPPFKGSLDEGDVHKTLTQEVKTKKTELLFLILILRMLKKGAVFAVLGVVLVFMVFVVAMATGLASTAVAKIAAGGVVLVTGIGFGAFAELARNYLSLAKTAEDIATRCGPLVEKRATKLVDVVPLLDMYNTAVARTAPIPEYIYLARRDQLNAAWAPVRERFARGSDLSGRGIK